MNILRYIISLPVAVIIGGLLNLGLLFAGMALIPFPGSVDIMDPESIRAALPDFELKHYITPFVSHAGGTLVGAFLAALLAPKNKLIFAMIIGAFFLVGGIMNTKAVPAPMWYNIVDIAMCYIPMAFIGYRLALKVMPEKV